MYKRIIFILTLFCSLLMLFYSDRIFISAQSSIITCIEKTVPSIFIFSVICRLAYYTNALEPLFKRLKIFAATAEPVFWGSFAGFPIGARLTCEMHKAGQLTKKEANYLLAFCNNCSPAFLIGCLNNKGLAVYILQLVSALITALCLYKPLTLSKPQVKKGVSLAKGFTLAIKDSVTAMGLICGTVIFMGAVCEFLNILHINTHYIYGILEISRGLREVIPTTPFSFGAVCFYAAFGSFSVMLQAAVFIEEAGLSLKCYALGKAVSGVICFFLGLFYMARRLDLLILTVIIPYILSKILKTPWRTKNAYKQPKPKFKPYKRRNEAQRNP